MKATMRLLTPPHSSSLSGAVFLAFGMLLATGSEAKASGAWQLIELNEVTLYPEHYIDEGRDELIYPNKHRDALNLSVDMDVLSFFYWNNTVMSVTDESQYRGVGLNSRIGIRLTPWLSVQYDHTSKHVLDGAHSYLPRYPVYDGVGFIIQIYKAKGAGMALIE